MDTELAASLHAQGNASLGSVRHRTFALRAQSRDLCIWAWATPELDGSFKNIGGSTAGGSRRVLDDWHPPEYDDLRHYFAEEGKSETVAEEGKLESLVL